MKKKAFVCLFLLFALISVQCFGAIAGSYSGIDEFFSLYNTVIPEDALEAMRTNFAPISETVGPVTLTELVADGRSIYASVHARTNEPDAYLILPVSASIDDSVSGGIPTADEREDRRTFTAYAEDKGLGLLLAHVSLEYEPQTDFFMGHFQKADGGSVLTMGGDLKTEAEEIALSWRVITQAMTPGTPIEGTRQVLSHHHIRVAAIG